MKPDHLRYLPGYLVHILIATASACAPVKPAPPSEPTPIRYCLPEETDVGNDDIPSLSHHGDSLLFITGDVRDEVSIYEFTRRGNTICATEVVRFRR